MFILSVFTSQWPAKSVMSCFLIKRFMIISTLGVRLIGLKLAGSIQIPSLRMEITVCVFIERNATHFGESFNERANSIKISPEFRKDIWR